MKTNSQLTRPQQVKDDFIRQIEVHLDDLVHSRAEEMFEIERFAELMFIHPTHLSNTIKELTGETPCGIFQTKILETAKRLLADPALPIRNIAYTLSFEPSQFSKWFRRFTGESPKMYRSSLSVTTS